MVFKIFNRRELGVKVFFLCTNSYLLAYTFGGEFHYGLGARRLLLVEDLGRGCVHAVASPSVRRHVDRAPLPQKKTQSTLQSP